MAIAIGVLLGIVLLLALIIGLFATFGEPTSGYIHDMQEEYDKLSADYKLTQGTNPPHEDSKSDE